MHVGSLANTGNDWTLTMYSEYAERVEPAKRIQTVGVYCASSFGANPSFLRGAQELGTLLGERGMTLVYGGARVGLMGAVADAVLTTGGHVIGVIPDSMIQHEVAHAGLPDLRVVASMHERKAVMAELSDAFVSLPGGYGTMDETFEILTWAQLGLHNKPCVLCNLDGYYDLLLSCLDGMVTEGLVRPAHRALAMSAPTPTAAIELLEQAVAAASSGETKWDQPLS